MNVSLPSRTNISAPSPSVLVSTNLDVKPSRLKALFPCGVAVKAGNGKSSATVLAGPYAHTFPCLSLCR